MSSPGTSNSILRHSEKTFAVLLRLKKIFKTKNLRQMKLHSCTKRQNKKGVERLLLALLQPLVECKLVPDKFSIRIRIWWCVHRNVVLERMNNDKSANRHHHTTTYKRKTIDRKLIQIFLYLFFNFSNAKHKHRERRIRNSEFLFIISAYPLSVVCLLLFIIGDGGTGNIWNICCFHLLRLFWMHLSKNSMWLVIALSCLSNNFRSSFRINCHWMISIWRYRSWSRCWHAIGYDFTKLRTARSFLPVEPVSVVMHFPLNETRITGAVALSPIEWDEALTKHFYSVKLTQQSILKRLDLRSSVFIGKDGCAICLFRMKGKPARERRNGWVSVGLYRWTWSFYSNRDLITNENKIRFKISRDDERLCRGCHCAIPPNSVRQ